MKFKDMDIERAMGAINSLEYEFEDDIVELIYTALQYYKDNNNLG